MKIAKLNGKPEIFYTLQGEGRNVGVPSVFVRLSLCNLFCRYCDSDYTWNWEGTKFVSDRGVKFKKEEQIIEMTPVEIMAEVKKYNCKNIILTGGEPMLQQKELLILTALEPSFHYEVETNGTIRPSDDFDKVVTQFNVSPKLENSGNPLQLRDKVQVMTYFVNNPKAWFKFVIVTPKDLEEVEGLVTKYGITRLYLMPEGTTTDELQAKSVWLAEICKNKGWRFSSRLQVLLWGAKRGV